MAVSLSTPVNGVPLDAPRARGCFHQALEVFQPQLLPDLCRKTSYYLGQLELAAKRWDEAAQALRLSVQATEMLDEGSALRGSREAALAELDNLFREAAYCLARTGHLEEAVVALERGRARRLAEALMDRGEINRLAALDAGLVQRFEEAAAGLREVERDELAMSAGHDTGSGYNLDAVYRRSVAARTRLTAVLGEIRRRPGFGDFRRVADFSRIARAVLPERPLLYLTTGLQGSLALLLSRPPPGKLEESQGVQVEAHWLDSFWTKDLERLLEQRRREPHATSPRDLKPAKATDAAASPTDFLAPLGDALLAPVVPRLRALAAKSVVLIPCGPLGVLPLHAASFGSARERGCLLDEVDVSYAPSAVALAAADAAAARTDTSPPVLAGVGDPQSESAPLPFACAELEEIGELFDQGRRRKLFGSSATKTALLAAATGASHLHLACHGAFDAAEPLDSALALAAGNLTLREILALDAFRDSRMTVLSACQTALTDFLRSTDEAIGLPVGFLMAGVTGVAGTLWSVNDLSTALTMTRFYELQLRGGPDGTTLPPASALCHAQRWLRDLTQEELDRYLLSHPSLGRSAVLPPLALHARPFSDPFYWAPFVFVGA